MTDHSCQPGIYQHKSYSPRQKKLPLRDCLPYRKRETFFLTEVEDDLLLDVDWMTSTVLQHDERVTSD